MILGWSCRWRPWAWPPRSGPGSPRLLRTPRADALRDAADGNKGADRIARLLEDRDSIHPSINAVHSVLLLTAAVPAAWLVTRRVTGGALVVSLLALVMMIWLVGDYLARGFGRARSRTLAYRLAPLLVTTAQMGQGRQRIRIGGRSRRRARLDVARTATGKRRRSENSSTPSSSSPTRSSAR